ncbi:chitobiase/beta-hexosaminidase C-terminal domain-containing protein [Rheinheimera nanhaiensis]|uniref:Fibronectin type-III domain-containing protein n=1 Tax=Rheinheimera nanhaiensis E407-8 TaxID=562729 RepID=I1E2S4_9GAMM|nr:chitobiase/beta-hexosaminidase C-terminal domain-containing protein [Rheinheimera nanhaiensis]GAB60602.1 hypothetical protein RNAN_3628 [Rheinheimera nanhaiensis E407-8]
MDAKRLTIIFSLAMLVFASHLQAVSEPAITSQCGPGRPLEPLSGPVEAEQLTTDTLLTSSKDQASLIQTVCVPPGVPTNPQTVLSGMQVTFSWSASANAVHYLLKQKTNSSLAGEIYIAGTSRSFTGAEGYIYAFQVSACNDYGCSPYTTLSNTVTLPAKPSTPPPPAAAFEVDKVKASWSPISGVTQYWIQQSINGGTWTNETNLGSVRYLYVPATANARYQFRIKACNAAGCSGYSAGSNIILVTKAATPSLSVGAGTYVNNASIALSSTAGATIRYTTNGASVTVNSAIYTSPIAITSNTTLMAKAYKAGMLDSDQVTAVYNIKPSTPTISPGGGSFNGATTVSLGSPTSGATLRYTLNNTAVTASSAVYSSPLNISSNSTVRVRAYKAGLAASDEASATFTIKAIRPTISPAGGSFTGSTTVSLSSPTSGATLRYTLNNTAVTSSSAVYSGPLTISSTSTLRVRAYKSGMADSDEASASFSIKALTPTISPTGGTFTGSTTVSLTSPTSGATLRYTVNNTAVTSSSAVYSGPLTISGNTTLRVRAYKSGMADSDEASASFTIKVPVPTLVPQSGVYDNSTMVTITSNMSGATVRYTLNNTAVTASSTIYSGPFPLTSSATIRAKAFKSGLADSNEVSSQITITPFSKVKYIHSDVLGSVIAESDEAGNVTKKTDYKPFGESKDN